LKVEQIHGMRFEPRREAKDEVLDWLQFFIIVGFIRRLAITAP
jgi:hypothetical protein